MMSIDLTPKERKSRQQLNRIQFAIIVVLVAAVLFIAAQSYLRYATVQRLQSELETTESTILAMKVHEAEARALQAEIQTMSHELDVLQGLLNSQVPWQSVLMEIADMIPQNARLTSVSARMDGSIALVGTAFTHEDAAQVAVELHKSEMFERADILVSNASDGTVEFNVSLRLADIPLLLEGGN